MTEFLGNVTWILHGSLGITVPLPETAWGYTLIWSMLIVLWPIALALLFTCLLG